MKNSSQKIHRGPLVPKANPGCFPLGSLRSRAAARALAEAKRRRDQIGPELVAGITDPLFWLQQCTSTRDSHWRETGAKSAYRPVPEKAYFRPLLEVLSSEKVVFIEKSRDMMLSWLCVGYLTHTCMTTESIEVLFQSQTEEKAAELVGYAKCLYEQQHPEFKAAYPLAQTSSQQSGLELHFANGSRIIGIPHGADKVRSYHPWALLIDEAAFMPEAGEAYEEAIAACPKIVVVSSAGPGWFESVCESACTVEEVVRGLSKRKTPSGITVMRCHYSADPDRDPAINPRWKEGERKKYTSQAAWDKEQEIVHSAGGGERLFADILLQWGHKIIIDPKESGFQVSPHWRKIGGFDSGKANPTAALSGCVDDDGTIYICCEYYQPGLSPQQHVPMLGRLRGFLEADVYADPTIFYENQAQADGRFKAIASLYAEAGIECLISAPERHELLGMERILAHWHDPENREPTLKIVCQRKYQNIALPIHGLHNEGCPNLLWELRRARREESSAAQLVKKNPSERIVDKDNHLRDCLKYVCLALPDPAEKTFEQRVREAIRPLAEAGDLTSAYVRYQQMKAEEEYSSGPPVRLGRYVPRRSR